MVVGRIQQQMHLNCFICKLLQNKRDNFYITFSYFYSYMYSFCNSLSRKLFLYWSCYLTLFRDWRSGSSGRMPALQIWSPEFNIPSPTKKKEKKPLFSYVQFNKWRPTFLKVLMIKTLRAIKNNELFEHLFVS
jgi:hypothetical protein